MFPICGSKQMIRGLCCIYFLAGTIVAAAGHSYAQNSSRSPAAGAFVGGAAKQLLEHGSKLDPGKYPSRSIQHALRTLGLYKGEIDGVLGDESAAAIRRFQRSIGKPVTGILTHEEAEALILRASTDVKMTSHPSTTGATGGTATASYTGSEIYASRLFAGPDDYPPTNFAAYGILAFKSRASHFDRDRQVMICEAYVNSIRPFDQIGKPVAEQMATVWPVASRETALLLSKTPERQTCGIAVDQYGNLAADKALRDAVAAGVDLDGLGPYLLAWSPPRKKGQPDAIVLVADLSDVKDYETALSVMFSWVEDIERDPKLWSNGWSVEALRLKAQKWFDRRGAQLLLVIGD